jgi:energy-coupling factor transport system substrate-specific component
MTANRVYRKKLNFEIVLEELKKGRGTQFDPQLVDIMLKLISEGKINVEELYADN